MQSETWKTKTFHDFCIWLKNQVADETSNVNLDSDTKLDEYANSLLNSGVNSEEVSKQKKFIRDVLFRIDIQKWNKKYAEDNSRRMIYPPNNFMVEVVEELPVGKVLDVGMGEGRNLLYLARKGWKTTGLEASKEGYMATIKRAETENLDINLILDDYNDYDFGKDKWDLILLLYVPIKSVAERVIESLTPGGKLIVEAYHDDCRNYGNFGDKVTFQSKEILEIFGNLKIYKYEEVLDFSDFGLGKIPVVRLYAGK